MLAVASPTGWSGTTVAAGSGGGGGGDDSCAICCEATLTDVAADAALATLDCCSHSFCFGCITRWVTEGASACPLCNGKIARVDRRRTDGTIVESVPIEAREQRPPEPTEAELREMADQDEHYYDCVVCQARERCGRDVRARRREA